MDGGVAANGRTVADRSGVFVVVVVVVVVVIEERAHDSVKLAYSSGT